MPIRTKAQKTAGLSGGEGMQEIFSMAYAPSSPDIVYVLADVNGPWKSTDGGTTWTPKFRNFSASGGSSIAVHPSNPNIVFASGNAMLPDTSEDTSDNRMGIYRSTDGGENWQLVRVTKYTIPRPDGRKAGYLVAFTSGGNTIYAGTETEGLLKSTDGGTTWVKVAKSGGGTILSDAWIYDVKVHPSNNSILFVCTNIGFFKITDSGSSATQVKITVLNNKIPFAALIHPSNGNIIYLNLVYDGIYKTTDGGTSWTVKNNGLMIDGSNQITGFTISKADPMYLYLQSYQFDWPRLFYSRNGGDSWVKPSSTDEQNADGWVGNSAEAGDGNTGPDAGNYYGGPIIAHPTNRDIALTNGTSNKIKRTVDGGVNWRYAGSGYTGGRVVDIKWDKLSANNFVMFLFDYGPYVTTNGGDTFSYMRAPRYNGQRTTNAGAVDPNNFNRVITAIGDWNISKVVITRNGGLSWTFVDGTEGGLPAFAAFHPTNPDVAYTGRFKFTNFSSSDPNSQNSFSKLDRPVTAMFPGNGNIVYSHLFADGVTKIYKSTDGGLNWTTPYPNIPTFAYQIAIDPANADKIYVAARYKGLYVINGTSLSLKNADNGLKYDQFGSLHSQYVAIDPRTPSTLYLGMWAEFSGPSNGIFRSTDGGNTWTNISGNIGPYFSPYGIFVSPFDSSVYVGSSHGTWKLSSGGSNNTAPAAPSGLRIIQDFTKY
ncbi:MAG: hypothetical protein IT291_01270 [Deltaproteobacteria bacterium]|nr:hypothetical protein [Deltaproteobacteria bacterium]